MLAPAATSDLLRSPLRTVQYLASNSLPIPSYPFFFWCCLESLVPVATQPVIADAEHGASFSTSPALAIRLDRLTRPVCGCS